MYGYGIQDDETKIWKQAQTITDNANKILKFTNQKNLKYENDIIDNGSYMLYGTS